MLPSLQRGSLTPPPSQVLHFLQERGIVPKPKPLRQLRQVRQLSQLKRQEHDIIIDTGCSRAKLQLLIFLCERDNVPATYLVGGGGGSAQRLHLGEGISPQIFKGTVIEVKYSGHTFHVRDVLLFKGEPVESRSKAIMMLNSEVLPFLTRPQVFEYSDIPKISGSRLIFLPRGGGQAWLFVPNSSLTAVSQS